MKKTPCFASFSYWGVHWLKLAPELKKVPGGKTTTHNILFEPILPNFEEIFEIGHDDFGGCPTLPVRKTGALWRALFIIIHDELNLNDFSTFFAVSEFLF